MQRFANRRVADLQIFGTAASLAERKAMTKSLLSQAVPIPALPSHSDLPLAPSFATAAAVADNLAKMAISPNPAAPVALILVATEKQVIDCLCLPVLFSPTALHFAAQFETQNAVFVPVAEIASASKSGPTSYYFSITAQPGLEN